MANGFRQNVWVLPISAVVLAAVVIAVPQHLTFNPAFFNVNLPRLDFSLSVVHLSLGSISLAALCLNIWPWLRERHVAVHRWSGRVYVFAALSAALLTMPLVLLNNAWQGDFGAAAIGGFWFVSTLIGYVAIRRGDEAKHRRWMLYSFAMATSFVWGVALGSVFTNVTPAQLPYLVEAIRWVGPLINLGVVKWWLDHTAQRGAKVIPLNSAPRLRTAARLEHTDHTERRAA